MLNESQTIAFERLKEFIEQPYSKNGENQQIILSGGAGTGKSYLISLLAKEYNIELTATTNKAATVIDGQTIHSFLGLELKRSKNSGEYYLSDANAHDYRNTVIAIDEVSMMQYDLYYLLKKHTRDCKIIYMGDYYQLPPVDKTNFSIFNIGLEVLMLKDCVRAQHDDIKYLVNSLKDSVENNKVFSDFVGSENIIIVKDKQQCLEILKSFNFPRDRVVSYTNRVITYFNAEIRRLNNKKHEFDCGDLILCKSSVVDIHSKKGIRTKIEEELIIDNIEHVKDDLYKIHCDNGGSYYCYKKPNQYLDMKSYLYNQCLESKHWDNYFGFLENVLDIRDNYAQTVHSSQGSSYKSVMVNIPDIMKCDDVETLARLLYVAISRATDKVYLYYGDI